MPGEVTEGFIAELNSLLDGVTEGPDGRHVLPHGGYQRIERVAAAASAALNPAPSPVGEEELARIIATGSSWGNYIYAFDRDVLTDEKEELLKIARAIIARVRSGGEGWRPISTAPKTGEHILVARFDGSVGFGRCGDKDQPWMDVVHWYSWPEGGEPGGFYSSSWGGDPDAFDGLTHWTPLPAPPEAER